ncbi:MAG: glucose-1-phosphate thymidylyltransferase [Halobacteriota archaeon]|nr:glucose-1-phosphate thymidylyltransferase [Halobacteriota archaeon]
MKGLILSGGYGTRLRPLTYSLQKQLIPVANKPILFYAIEDLIEAGIEEIGVIVGPNKELVIETVKSRNWDAKIEFIYQDQPKGLSHTILVAENFLGNHSFAMYLGDNILSEGIVEHLADFVRSDCEASILLTEVSNPREFGLAKLNEKGEIEQLVEKPKDPPSNLAIVGIYFFKPTIFKAAKEIKPSWRNQLEITDAIQWLIEHKYKVKSSMVRGWWKDTGKPEDILHANRLVLDEIKGTNVSNAQKNIKLVGRVDVGDGTIIDLDSVIKGPVLIGNNCIIKNAYIGPYTSIGNDCKIIGMEIEDSVVMDGTTINGSSKIVNSLIGKDVRISKNNCLPKGYRLVIGDNSEVEL